MTKVYPIIITPTKPSGYCVNIPDFNSTTQGETIAEAIFMARDAIGIHGICLEDEKRPLPEPRPLSEVKVYDEENGIFGNESSIVTLVDVDFTEYRRANDNRTVKKNCPRPAWLCTEAERRGINFSRVLADALHEKLGV